MNRSLSEFIFRRNRSDFLLLIKFLIKNSAKKINSEKKNGRFCGINEDDFDSEKGVALALDNDSGKHVIVKAIFPRKTSELENARREAQTLAQLGQSSLFSKTGQKLLRSPKCG